MLRHDRTVSSGLPAVRAAAAPAPDGTFKIYKAVPTYKITAVLVQ